MSRHERFDRGAFHRMVEEVRRHPAFGAARDRFTAEVPLSRLFIQTRHDLNADTGSFALIMNVVAHNRIDPVNGAAVSTIIRTLEQAGVASATRLRALIDQMIDRGMMRVVSDPHDRRRKRLELTEPFVESQRNYFETVLESVAMVFDLPATPQALAHMPDLMERYWTSVVLRAGHDNFVLMEGMPEIAAFMDRKHGYLLMLELAGAHGLATEVHRAAMAERYGVSPAHIAGMLADAEKKGWVRRELPSSRIALAPDFAEQLEIWIARELTIVGMWVIAKLGPPPALGSPP